jgi:hypothetical protein
MSIDLFADLRKRVDDLHPQFVALRDQDGFAPARIELQKLQATFDDVDGNFVEQFQTTGFDSRTFELYLYQLFREVDLTIDRTHTSPDFLVSREDLTVAVEAVTANPAQAEPYKIFGAPNDDPLYHLRHEAAVRLGSPLFSKLQKKYWELPHVQGRPIILAIEDFHEAGALMQTATPLVQYLYGVEQRWYHDENGTLVITEHEIKAHQKKNLTEIPSGFFSLPNADMISAVLWTNNGTITKFNRMGQQALGAFRKLKMLRAGIRHDLNPNATRPIPFVYEVGRVDAPVETWREASTLMLNPKAKYPLPSGWLGAAVEMRRDDAGIVSTAYEPFIPHSSITLVHSADTPRSVLREIGAVWQSKGNEIVEKLKSMSLGSRPL